VERAEGVEATGADIEYLGLERGHRTLTITRKGGKVVCVPLAPRTAQAIDLATADMLGKLVAGDGRLTARRTGRSVPGHVQDSTARPTPGSG